MKSISFLLPSVNRNPVGGYKVVYEYANRLVGDGYDVHIVYPVSRFFIKKGLKYQLRAVLRYLYYRFYKKYSANSWFSLDNRVKEHLAFSLNHRHVPKTDFYVATFVETAMYLNEYNIPLINKLYLIQGYENWNISDKEVIETYQYGMKNIVTSKWLADMVKQSGAIYSIIPVGFDFDYFRLECPITKRKKYCIAMLYHTQKIKGCEYGLEALEIVKEKYPQLEVRLFGFPVRPKEIPDYIKYYNKPDRETHLRIYNDSAIYLAPSIEEGWGLPVGEAMICGAAVVCTDNKGFREMAEDGKTALMSPPCDAQSLAENIIKLIEDDELRIRIAEEGNRNIQSFTWDASYAKLKKLIHSSRMSI